ncbi:hypothetical protein HOY82DRAFT_599686 [Tuber indicum]|nr:hypothetical protein HOY82DRAFT_599686 [Tuber indicum]
MVGVILKQLVGRGDIPMYLREAFQEARRELGGRRPPSLSNGSAEDRFCFAGPSFICIDALDECLPKHLSEPLGSLSDSVRESPKSVDKSLDETNEEVLEQEGVNPDQVDTEYGRTPLPRAAECGHEGIATMLSEREGVNPEWADTQFSSTPLSWAAGRGHEGVSNTLLERNDVRATELAFRSQRRCPSAEDAGVARNPLGRDNLNSPIADRCGQSSISLTDPGEPEGV